ncbi:YdiY family protein [Desulfurivibrio sp. C05AmB]|jgi:putative salt-induced outer membrane protein YdiY|uniref:DUF481 domain-containing protein n=1 Tax=Desulfurivibrio sp. C05AmB TaxID=3374371 RepID=UPI00376F237E
MIFRTCAVLLWFLLLAVPLTAGVVETRDGSRLVGKIIRIDQGLLHLETGYAGTLAISQDQVVSFSSEDELVLRLAGGATMTGRVAAADSSATPLEPVLEVHGEDGVLRAPVSRVAAVWQKDQADPEISRLREEKEKMRRRWQYEAGLDLLGKEGNVREFGLGANFTATLKSPDDALKLISEYERREKNDEKTADRLLGAIDYEAFFHERYGWYVRTALEKDDIELVDLRSTSGAGFSYRLLNREHHSLVARTGLGYRYTSYIGEHENDSDPTLDLGLFHRFDFGQRWSLRNELTYSPSISAFSDYLVHHESALEMPVGTGEFWKLRLGVRNDYDSQPAADKKLDTTYYTRMILNWQ